MCVKLPATSDIQLEVSSWSFYVLSAYRRTLLHLGFNLTLLYKLLSACRKKAVLQSTAFRAFQY